MAVLVGVLTVAGCAKGEPAGTTATSVAPAAAAAPKPSQGCGSASASELPPGVVTPVTTTSGGKERVYRRYIPASIDRAVPVPLVLDLHGLTQPMDIQAAFSAWEALADTEHFVVLTPQGLGPILNWNSTNTADNVDVAYLRELIDAIGSQLCIDTSRVYAGGISNGGLASSILACQLADRIAAVGLVAGIRFPDDCRPSRPVPVIVFWGKQDLILPFYGGLGPGFEAMSNPAKRDVPVTAPTAPPADDGGIPPVETTVGRWAASNGCDEPPAVAAVSEHVERRTYGGCDAGAEVQLYVIADGGHNWPGSKGMGELDRVGGMASITGKTTHEIDATTLMWAFYERFRIG